MERYIGRDLARPDGPAKVEGRAVYVADLDVPGAWVGGVVRSTVARGLLLGLDFDPGFDWRTVAVATAADVPGENVVALIADDQPLLVAREIEHWGEPLALVAAPDELQLARALAAVRPRIEARAACFDLERSPRVFKSIRVAQGDAGAVFRDVPPGARVVEGTYRTDSQEQLYVETQGFVAFPPASDGSVTVRGSLQCPHYVQKALARALGIAPEEARVVQLATGGGFGGKEDYPSVLACHAALLARVARRPVRLILGRHEDLAVTPKRHPARVRVRAAFAADGTGLALEADVLFDGGAYTTLSPVVLSRGVLHASGPYRWPAAEIRGSVVATNHVPYGAFRGFGAPQTCLAIERLMDRAARELGIHPFELRLRNALRPGDTTVTGQRLEHSVGSLEVLEAIARRTGFDRHAWGAPHAESGPRRRGLGFSFFFHGAGFTGSGEELLRGRVSLALLPDGRVEVLAGSTEIGQGTQALFTAIAAEALGADAADVVLATPDTARVPDSGPTVASRTCMVVGGVLAAAAAELRQRVGDGAASWRERARAFLAGGGDGAVTRAYAPPPGARWDEHSYRGDAYPVYGWAADVAEVFVDEDTGEVDVARLWTAVDVGRALQPRLVTGQIEGGALQAVGWAHREVVSARDGRCEQDRLATCIVPTTLDAPRFDVTLVEVPYPGGPFGAKGVGELPMDGGAPAVLSAIEDATGIHPAQVPATPERILDLLVARAEEAHA
ncbi:MAG: xanthine dehydrogenase family protein [Planctomycetes bacterium]|nr:xanthine dehydrogenase family protein [Planctomycetota bacterium]